MERNKSFLGILLIGVGGILLSANLLGFQFGMIATHWPLLLILLGLFFEGAYLADKKAPGMLVPGGILLVIGFLFEFEMLTHWRFSEYTWPIYLLAVAFGLLQLYFASDRPRGLLFPIAILSSIAVIAYLSFIYNALAVTVNLGLIIPLILIVSGLLIILRR
ncbi:hypothetical protein Desdi_1042 [Desulfitobacterium dichloroeliminans LMG P-21439]|uniref:LiaF transmembrane domain-containing protein n=1 Tax=Desulfitobacterium dichloroeliminans (strain LMG P-21439 / DCA1) TaxID=871963 RepID=L0F416_DESDL|nr:hypothetical protein [Desulfitobacterium dichloroeliminans]AGA68559.1 hypothetical protein Desdi_1042 [Desulfitobacterium dichloroeliminans LMG P-21439]